MNEPLDEVSAWRMRKTWNDQDMRGKRRSRYMADVRHPLKQILHGDVSRKWLKNRRPVAEVKVLPPDMAKCAKCGELVNVSDRMHPCFNQRVWSHLK